MRRFLSICVCLFSLLLAAAVVAVIVHTHGAWHTVVWRTDSRAAAEEAHGSLMAVWREYRACGRVPGERNGRKVRAGPAAPAPAPFASLAPSPAPPPNVTREYVSLVVANGRVEFRQYPENTPPFV